MLYFFHGQDTYRSRRAAHEIVDRFREKYDADLHVYWFDAEEERDPERMGEAARTGSLFSAKRMVVIERLCTQEALFESMQDVIAESAGRKDVFVILWEEKIAHDGRRKAEVCEKFADETQEFEPLKGPALVRWVSREAAARGVTLTDAVRSNLAAEGNNLWGVVNTLEKGALIAPHELEHSALSFSNVFALGDAFFISPAEAARHLSSLLASGENEHSLFGYLTNYTRKLLAIRAAAAEGRSMPADLKPFVVQKGLALVRRLPPGILTNRLRQFYEEDWKIKNGLSTPRESLFSMLLAKD